MKIDLGEFNGKIYNLMRKLGYHPDKNSGKNQPSFSKPLKGGKFPRFHTYYLPEKKQLNLHLDQKAARYNKETDHSGEYNSPLVKSEAKRIKEYVNN